MSKLIDARYKIDNIDNEIIRLFEERMNIVKEVIEYKIANNIPILDTNREIEMLKRHLEKINNEEYKQYYKYVLDGFLKASKDMQHDILNKK